MKTVDAVFGFILSSIVAAFCFEGNLFYAGGAFAIIAVFTLVCLFLEYLSPGSVFKD